MQVKRILCYCCEVWSFLGTNTALESMERIQLGFLKILLGVQVHTKTLHVLAEFGRYPLHVTRQSQAAKYLQRLESLSSNRILAQAFITDSKLPKKLSWQSKLATQLHPSLVATPTEERPERQSHSLHAVCSAHVAQLQSDPSSKTEVYRDIKAGFSCEPCIHNCSNKHLRRSIAQFRTGSHWLGMETDRHHDIARQDRTCQVQPSNVEPRLSSCSV